MAEDKTPSQCFEEVKDDILAIPDDAIAYSKMPYEEAMQEGQRVSALVEKYHDNLIKSDINPALLDTIGTRSGAFAHSVAVMDSFVKISESHIEIYQKKKKEGYEIRRRLLETLEYVFRFDKAVLDILDNIKNGAGDLDMIRDLNSIHLLCKNNQDRLTKAHVEQSLIDQALEYYTELSQLTAQIDIDPKRINEAKQVCAKAWTYLWEAMTEIYAAGRYVFYDEPDIQELFYIDYYQRIRKIRKKTEEENLPEETESPETSTTSL